MYDPTDVLNARGQLSVEALREMADQAALAASLTVGGGYLSASPGALAVVPGSALDMRDINSFHQPFRGAPVVSPQNPAPECWYVAGKNVDGLLVAPLSFVVSLGEAFNYGLASGDVLWASGNYLQAVPFWTGAGGTVDGLGIMYYHAGARGATVRVGVYAPGPNLSPGALLWDSGTIEADDFTTVGPIKFLSAPAPGGTVLPAGLIVTPPPAVPFGLSLPPGSLVWLAATLGPTTAPAPVAVSATALVKGTLPPGIYYYAVTALVGNTETAISTAVYGVTNLFVPGNPGPPIVPDIPARQTIQVTWSPYPGASGYNLYRRPDQAPSDVPIVPFQNAAFGTFLASVGGTSYIDDGSVPVSFKDRARLGFPPTPVADIGVTGLGGDYPVFGVSPLFDVTYTASGVWLQGTMGGLGRNGFRSSDVQMGMPDPFPPGVPNATNLPAILLRFSSAPGPGQG